MQTRGEPGPIQLDVGLVVTRGPGGIGYPVVGWVGVPGASAPIVLVNGERKPMLDEVVGLLHERAAWDAAWARHGRRLTP
jgi:hypothetical protein